MHPHLCTGVSVLDSARKPQEFKGSGIFTDEEERLIRAGLHKLFRRPALRCGGGEEVDLSRKLLRLARGPLHDVPGVYALGEKYGQVIGVYYTLKPLDGLAFGNIQSRRAQAVRDTEADLIWACDVQLRGDPTPASDFKLTCHYVLVKEDDTCERIVTLENIHGETSELVALPSRALTAPRDFREWLANQGNFVWLEREKILQKLQEDLNRDAAHMRVLEVTCFGFHQPSGIWFFEDVAYGPTAEPILPDEYDIFWWQDTGYKLADQGADQQSFRQPRPCLRPSLGLVFEGEYRLKPGVADHPEAITGLFQEFAHRLNETVGGRQGYALLGSFAAYAAAPEIQRHHGGFPGPWVNGQKGQGKTTLVSLLMEIFGFSRMDSGIGLSQNSTATGLQIALEQFSNLPLWGDEFKEIQVNPEKRAIIHSAFNRELPSKFAEKGRMRSVRTTFVISGEGTSGQSATRRSLKDTSAKPSAHGDLDGRFGPWIPTWRRESSLSINWVGRWPSNGLRWTRISKRITGCAFGGRVEGAVLEFVERDWRYSKRPGSASSPPTQPTASHAAATTGSATTLAGLPSLACRDTLAASTASGVMPNHFSASAARTSSR